MVKRSCTIAQLVAHLCHAGGLESAQHAFGGAGHVLYERYTQAKQKMTVSVVLVAECIKLHTVRMTFLLHLLGLKTRHALLDGPAVPLGRPYEEPLLFKIWSKHPLDRASQSNLQLQPNPQIYHICVQIYFPTGAVPPRAIHPKSGL